MRRLRRTSCPDCVRDVPSGRWCNRCGALLPPVGGTRPERAPRFAAAAAGVGLALGVVGVVLASAPRPEAHAPPVRDPAVVLAEDAPTPPPASPRAREAPVPMVDVVCSDLQRRSVPAELVGSTDPGALADLSWGPCVVMGPEGVAVP